MGLLGATDPGGNKAVTATTVPTDQKVTRDSRDLGDSPETRVLVHEVSQDRRAPTTRDQLDIREGRGGREGRGLLDILDPREFLERQ